MELGFRGESNVNDAFVLYFFGFLLVSNLIFSLLYALGTGRLKASVRRSKQG